MACVRGVVNGVALGTTGLCTDPRDREDAAMSHSTLCAVLLATPGLEGLAADGGRLLGHLQALAALLGQFGARPVTPEATYDLEHKLANQARALARDLLEGLLNRLEPDDAAHAPARLCHEGGRYRRRGKPPTASPPCS